MKKVFLILIIALTATVGCSKKSNIEPEIQNQLIGTWTATNAKVVYQNVDDTPYRNDFLTKDEDKNAPGFGFIIDKNSITPTGETIALETITLVGGESMPYVYHKDYLDVNIDGKKQQYHYSINGSTAILKINETNVPIKVFGVVIFTIPKVSATITLQKEKA